SAAAKGKQPSRATTPVELTDLQRTKAEQLKIVLKRSRQETHISQQSGSGTHEEGKKSDESDDSDEGSDNDSDETVKSGAGKDGDEDDNEDDDDDDEEEEIAKDNEEDKETGKGGNEVRESEGESKEEEETSEEEDGSFDPIPRTPEDSEKESNDEEEQESRLSDEVRIQEEEDADELYSNVNINQGMGLQVTQNVEDTHVTLTPVNPDAFRFEERLRSLETSFSEFRQTNQFADAVSAIPGIVHQYMDQQIKETVREAVQIQTDQLQDSIQRENDKFLHNIDENMKKALVEAYEADKAILDTYGDSAILKRRREDDDQEGPSAGPNRGSKQKKEGGEQASASTPSEKATKGAGGSTTRSQSRQRSASESAYAEEPVQTTCQMEETPHLEILAFIHFLGHSAAIKMLTDVNINKLYQPWRSFAALINKCLTGKSSGNSKAYKEYYAIATGEAAPKPKASGRRTKSSSNTPITPPTAAASPRLKAYAKGKQPAKASKAKSLSALSKPSGSGADEGTGSKPGVPDAPTDESEEELSWNFTNDEGDNNKEQDDDGDEEDEGDDGEEGTGDDNDDEDDGEEGDDNDADQEVVRDDDKDDDEEGGDDDAIKDEEPSGGPDRRSKRQREGKEPESESALTKTTTRSAGSIQPRISELAKHVDTRSSFNELMDTPLDFSNFIMNWLRVDTLTPELLAGPTYDLVKGSCKSLIELEYHLEEVYKAITDQLDWVNPKGQQYPHNLLQPLPLIPDNQGHRVIPFKHFINNDLEYLRGGASSREYTTSVTKTKIADYGHIKWIEDLVPRTMWIQEPIDYEKHALWGRRIIAVTKVKIVEWHSYKHLDWITNKDKKNRLMRIDELHKFSDGTLIDVRTSLDDRLKGSRMRYLPQTIRIKSDKDRAAAMIQAIDKRLKTRRIMRNLERFVRGRLYEGDFRMLRRTI
nr:hypothetical protein [Tanacetum cinerariifolium]